MGPKVTDRLSEGQGGWAPSRGREPPAQRPWADFLTRVHRTWVKQSSPRRPPSFSEVVSVSSCLCVSICVAPLPVSLPATPGPAKSVSGHGCQAAVVLGRARCREPVGAPLPDPGLGSGHCGSIGSRRTGQWDLSPPSSDSTSSETPLPGPCPRASMHCTGVTDPAGGEQAVSGEQCTPLSPGCGEGARQEARRPLLWSQAPLSVLPLASVTRA